MKQNVGVLDTAIRSVIAIIMLAIAAEGLLPGTLSMILVIMGLGLWISCASGVCPIYSLFGIDTYKEQRPTY